MIQHMTNTTARRATPHAGSFQGARSADRAGFTLLELLLAMSIFSLLGVGLIALLSRTTDFMTKGASTTETLDALQTFSEAFESDISTLYTQNDSEVGLPYVRLYSDLVEVKVDDDQQADTRTQRLFFVRMIPNEATARTTRLSGRNVDAEKYLDQDSDLDEAIAGDLKATGGLMEVFWMAMPDSMDDVAVMRLYRGFRSPIGGEGSLLPTRVSTDPSALENERGAMHRKEVLAVAKPILAGVLHFGVDFWSRKTKSWDSEQAPGAGGPLQVWDSTRAILPRGSGFQGFYYSKLSGNRTDDADSSLNDPTDDTYPRRVRVTLVVEELGRNAKVGRLTEPLPEDARFVRLSDTGHIPRSDTTSRFIKIGAEWMSFEDIDGDTLTGLRRGQRGTLAMNHDAGAAAHYGRTVVREYTIATYRDAYQDELPSIVGRR